MLLFILQLITNNRSYK